MQLGVITVDSIILLHEIKVLSDFHVLNTKKKEKKFVVWTV